MPLVNMKDMLHHAYRNGYAVGAFDLQSLDFLEGIVAAAESARAPVILSMDESHFGDLNFELAMSAVEAAAQRAVVPVAIQLDHGANTDSAVKAIRFGCNGITVDTPHLPLGENLDITRAVVKMAHACGVAVEGKLGYAPGVEEDEAEQSAGVVSYTTPAEAKGFVKRTGVDFLAISVGTVHVPIKNGKPKFDWSRLKEINAALDIPLVISGGAGVTQEQFHRLITMGVAKINYYTALSEITGDSIRTAVKSGARGYNALLAGVRTAVSAEVERCMRMWGAAGRAAEVLTQCRPWLNVERVVVYNASGLDGERIRLMEQGQRQLSAIPGVREVKVGSVADKSTRYRHCWLIRLASTAVIESFNEHTAHVDFADRLFRTAAADSLTADYLVASVKPEIVDLPVPYAITTAKTTPTMKRVKI